MKTRTPLTRAHSLILVLALAGSLMPAEGQGTAWTYQGELTKAGALYTGSADMLFSLWDAESGGSQSGSTLTVTNIAVTSGRFSARLDFGSDPFQPGENLWLQIAVRTPANSGGMYQILAARQPVTPSPYAIRTRGMFVADSGNVGFGTPNTLPDFNVQVSRTRIGTIGPTSATMGARHDQWGSTPGTNWLYLRTGIAGNELVRGDSFSDLRFLKESTIEDASPLTQMTLTGTGKLLLGTETEQSGLTLQVGSQFGVTFNGRVGFENSNPQAKIHFSNSSSTDCIRFPNGTVQNTAPFTDAGFVSGPGVAPGIVVQFLSVRKTVQITHSSQKIFVMASQQFGGTVELNLNIYIGYRAASSGATPTLVGAGIQNCQIVDNDCTGGAFCQTAANIPFTLSAIIENLQPGFYEVGMAGNTAIPGWSAGNGYVTAFVF
jgi:hypothetical protein